MGEFNIEQLVIALNETLFMTFVSLLFVVVIGLLVGIILFCSQKGSLFENAIVFKVLNTIVNVLRAIPFIILLVLIIPLTKFLVGTMLGAKAALPPLILSASPFFARLCVIAFNEVDKGTIEASKAMGASNFTIIYKVIIPESLPALLSAITVTGIALIGYTAMAGAIGAGGLGYLAYTYGFIRNNSFVTYLSTICIVLIVFIIQSYGDSLVRKKDKR